MTDTLAADAALIELSEWDIDETLGDACADETPNPLAVRDALLALAAIGRDVETVKTTKAQIVERYDDRIGTLTGRASAIRDSLQTYVERFGKTSFPDVGGVNLTTRKAKASIVDAVAVKDWLESNDLADVVVKHTATVEVFEAGHALDEVFARFEIETRADGKLVSHTTGELVEIAGVEVKAECKSLVVRGS